MPSKKKNKFELSYESDGKMGKDQESKSRDIKKDLQHLFSNTNQYSE